MGRDGDIATAAHRSAHIPGLAGAQRAGEESQGVGPDQSDSWGQAERPGVWARMRGQGIFAEQIRQMFRVGCRKAGLSEDGPELSVAAFRRPPGSQLELDLAAT